MSNFEFESKQSQLSEQYCSGYSADLISGIRGIDGDVEYNIQIILNSVTYDIANNIDRMQINLDLVQQTLRRTF